MVYNVRYLFPTFCVSLNIQVSRVFGENFGGWDGDVDDYDLDAEGSAVSPVFQRMLEAQKRALAEEVADGEAGPAGPEEEGEEGRNEV